MDLAVERQRQDPSTLAVQQQHITLGAWGGFDHLGSAAGGQPNSILAEASLTTYVLTTNSVLRTELLTIMIILAPLYVSNAFHAPCTCT